MRIVFFANHELAIPSFNDLIEKEMLVGLVMPDMRHEGNVRMEATVKARNIPYVYVNKKYVHNELAGWLAEKKPDAIFVMTFSYKLPESVLKIPKYGCFNWHTGVLPGYRGPDPVFWEIMNGESEGGVTLHRMDPEFDTGPIVKINKVPMGSHQTHGEHYKLIPAAARELVDYITDSLVIDPSGLESVSQNEEAGKYYARPEMRDLFIHWEKDSAEQIRRLVRATNPIYGGARTYISRKPLHLFQVTLDNPRKGEPSETPGTVITANARDGLVVISKDNVPVKLDVVYTEEGFYTGPRYAKVFDVKVGDKLQDPRF